MRTLPDAGNAEAMTRIYREDLIFVDALGWLRWNGRRWERSDHKALAAGIDLSARMLREALAIYRAALVKHAEAQADFAESGSKEAVTDSMEEEKKAKEEAEQQRLAEERAQKEVEEENVGVA